MKTSDPQSISNPTPAERVRRRRVCLRLPGDHICITSRTTAALCTVLCTEQSQQQGRLEQGWGQQAAKGYECGGGAEGQGYSADDVWQCQLASKVARCSTDGDI